MSQYQINCTVEKATGLDQDVVVKKRSPGQHNEGVAADGGVAADEGITEGEGIKEGITEGEGVATGRWGHGNRWGRSRGVFKSAVSFKERIDYRERFAKFVNMGVGGMKREINALYRRAFASYCSSLRIL